MWSQHCRIPRWLRCWFEVLFIVATKMRTVARQSYTGAREKLTELRGVKRARRFPLPRCLLSEEATSFTKVNWWRCQQYQRFADKKPAKSYKLSWNFCDLKNITKNMPEISSLVSTIGNGTSFDGFSNTNFHSFLMIHFLHCLPFFFSKHFCKRFFCLAIFIFRCLCSNLSRL